MKILINTLTIGETANGLAVYTVNMLDCLLKKLLLAGHSVTILSSGSPFVDSFQTYCERKPDLEVYTEHLTIRKVSALFSSRQKSGTIRALFRLLFNVFLLPFYAMRYDRVYTTTPHGMFFPLKKQIVTIHDLIPLAFPYQYRFQYYYMKYLLKYVLRACRRIIVISDTTETALLKLCPIIVGRTVRVYNGISEKFFPVENAVEKIRARYGVSNFLLACGISYEHKNIHLLIQAYAMLSEDMRRKHPLVIVGATDGAYAKSLREYVERLSIGETILFTGSVPLNELVTFYTAARVFIYPSLCEGFGMPPIEATCCGTQSIVADIPIMREVMGKAGVYFNPHDSRELKQKIMTLLNSSRMLPPSLPHSYRWENAANAVFRAIVEN